MLEFTARAVITGAILGMIFGASVVVPRAEGGAHGERFDSGRRHLARDVPRLSKLGVRDATILENNITPDGGSAGESIAFGVGVTMPAILILASISSSRA
jgi:uncharacterized oligopeptide transporter (OPT) family protein